MAVNSGSGVVVATTPDGGSPDEPSSSEDISPSPDAAINIQSSCGAPKKMLALLDEPAKSPGNRMGCSLCEELEVRGDVPGGEALTVTLRSPRVPAGSPLLEPERPGWVAAEGFRKERLDRSKVMLRSSSAMQSPLANISLKVREDFVVKT